MTWQDAVNGAFECFAGFFVLLHCIRLYKDKMVRGVSVVATMFFSSWGFWNLYYYPHLDQWLSFFGGILIVTANVAWVYLLVYYKAKERREAALRAAYEYVRFP